MEKTKILCNRYFSAILYPEDPNYKTYMKNIIDNFTEVTWIDHNKDLNNEGEIKKLHTHIIFKVGENARWRNAIAEIIGCEPNMIEGCKRQPMLLYLLHKNNPEKTQYTLEEVQGDKTELERILLKDETPENKASILFCAILQQHITNMTSLIAYAIDNNLLSTLQKNQMLFYNMVKENKENEYKKLRTTTRERERYN